MQIGFVVVLWVGAVWQIGRGLGLWPHRARRNAHPLDNVFLMTGALCLIAALFLSAETAVRLR